MVAGVDRVYLGVQADPEQRTSDAVAVHEYVHLLVETNVPAAPLWLNEGLAEFFAAGRLDESPAVFGLPHTGHLSDSAVSRMAAPRRAAHRHARLGERARPMDVGDLLRAGVAAGPLPEARRRRTTRGAAHRLHRQGRAGRAGEPGGRRGVRRSHTADVVGFTPTPAASDSSTRDSQASARIESESSRRPRALRPGRLRLTLGDFLTHVQHFDEASRLLAQAAELVARRTRSARATGIARLSTTAPGRSPARGRATPCAVTGRARWRIFCGPSP